MRVLSLQRRRRGGEVDRQHVDVDAGVEKIGDAGVFEVVRPALDPGLIHDAIETVGHVLDRIAVLVVQDVIPAVLEIFFSHSRTISASGLNIKEGSARLFVRV